MRLEHWWNDTDWAEPKCSQTRLQECPFVHNKSHVDWPGTEAGSPRCAEVNTSTALYVFIAQDV